MVQAPIDISQHAAGGSQVKQHREDDLRAGSPRSDPKAEALFETSAEVLGGLIKAFTDFEQRDETAWKK